MKTTLKKLGEIIEKYRKHYKGDPFWQDVATYFIEQDKELREMLPDLICDGDFPIRDTIEEILGE